MSAGKREYKKAKSSRIQDEDQMLTLASELSATRSAARDAQREFDALVGEHQCKE
jgi:hypothetical protein